MFADHICAPYRTPEVAVEVQVEPEGLTLTSDQAGSVGMILNEAVCNAFKHAFLLADFEQQLRQALPCLHRPDFQHRYIPTNR